MKSVEKEIRKWKKKEENERKGMKRARIWKKKITYIKEKNMKLEGKKKYKNDFKMRMKERKGY